MPATQSRGAVLSSPGRYSTHTLTRYNTPPWPSALTYVHDSVTHGEEDTGAERFREEVSKIVDGTHKRTTNLVIFHELTNEEVAAFYVFHAPMMLRVVGHIDGRLVVDEQVWGTISTESELLRAYLVHRCCEKACS